MTLYAPIFLQATTGDTAISYSGQDFRGMISALAAHNGTVLAGDLKVTPRAAGSNLSVDVAAGRCLIAGTSVANQGTYVCRSDAVTNVPITSNASGNPRIDVIVARVYDKQADGGTTYGWNIYAVAGTPSSSPVAPALPASTLALAQVYVPNAATSIVTAGTNASGGTGSITDIRVLSCTGDVPKWDLGNQNPTAQVIPSGSSQLFQYAAVNQAVGVGYDSTVAKVTLVTPGRYFVHFGFRLAAGGSVGEKTAIIQLWNPAGTQLLREISNSIASNTSQPVNASGSFYATAGQYVTAGIYQNTGVSLSINDQFFNADFTGCWMGS